jgi:N-acetylglucosamine-6-phosphate deacetylase
LRNARLVLPDRIVEGNLVVMGDRIAQINDTLSTSANDKVIDASGLTIFPGFIDVHIHGAMGVDVMTASPADLDSVSRYLASRGVTGWLPTFVPAPASDYANAINAITAASAATGGAQILGVHYEGPFVNSSQCGALHTEYFRSFRGTNDLADLPQLKHSYAKHMITVAPEIDDGIELIRELTRRGWIVSIGHTRATTDLLDDAFSAGARHMTHFMNAMAPLHHRAPGPVGWGLLRDDVTCDLIADGIHLDPQALALLVKLKTASRLSLISDAVAAAGKGDGSYEIWGETITVTNGRTANARGSIAGSVITMLEAVQMMLSLGTAETDVARMAATNPATLLGIGEKRGSIAEGKRADLVALDANQAVAFTMIGGVMRDEG